MDSQSAAESSSDSGIGIVLLLVVCLYFLPTIVALLRKAQDRGTVIVINLFLGWTFVGWVSALAIATRSRVQPIVINPQTIVVPQATFGPPSGWYPDPSGSPALERFWDGAGWTASSRRASLPSSGWA